MLIPTRNRGGAATDSRYAFSVPRTHFDVKWVTLKDIVKFRNGKGHEKEVVDNGNYVVINSKFVSTGGKIKKYVNTQLVPLDKEDIVMVMSDLPNGKALAKCYYVEENGKYTLNQRIGGFRLLSNSLLSKFLYYILDRNSQLLRYDNGADQTNLRKEDILKIKIPVPSLAEQERIVKILDRFEALCNDITVGLPAEIKARQQQYEYYRNKLLTFEEVKA